MANNPQKKRHFFIALNSLFKQQSAQGTALVSADLDTRHAAQVTLEDVKQRETVYDCYEQDIADEVIQSQLKRVTITYTAVTAQIILGWLAYLFGAAANPTGTAQNEVETVTIDATGGVFTWSKTHEGKTGTTAAMAFNATAAVFQAAVEKIDWLAGNVTVTKAGQVFTVTYSGQLAKANLTQSTTNPAGLTGGAQTAVVVTTQQGGNNYHAVSRSTDDSLPPFSFATGFESGTAANPEEFRDFRVESVNITLPRRKNVGLTVVAVGRFTPEVLAGFAAPACNNVTALKTADCKARINGSWVGEDFWDGNITVNNNAPVGDDAFGFDSIEIQTVERGEKPTQNFNLQILGSKGDAVYTLCENESKVAVEIHLGRPGDRASIIAGNTKLKFGTNRTQYVGEANRTAIQIEGTPHKNGSSAPVRAEGYIDQPTAFLQS